MTLQSDHEPHPATYHRALNRLLGRFQQGAQHTSQLTALTVGAAVGRLVGRVDGVAVLVGLGVLGLGVWTLWHRSNVSSPDPAAFDCVPPLTNKLLPIEAALSL